MLFIITRDSHNKEWQADIKEVKNFRLHKISEVLLTARWTVGFSLTAVIHAAVQKLNTTLLSNRYRNNIEYKFNSALCSKIPQIYAQVEILFWTVLRWFSSEFSLLVLLLTFNILAPEFYI
jgi:hypothetical protein